MNTSDIIHIQSWQRRWVLSIFKADKKVSDIHIQSRQESEWYPYSKPTRKWVIWLISIFRRLSCYRTMVDNLAYSLDYRPCAIMRVSFTTVSLGNTRSQRAPRKRKHARTADETWRRADDTQTNLTKAAVYRSHGYFFVIRGNELKLLKITDVKNNYIESQARTRPILPILTRILLFNSINNRICPSF
jgi:hypothetical protein